VRRVNTKEIFEATVRIMKDLLTPEGMSEAIRRIKARGEEDISDLLQRERENINDLVVETADRGGSPEALKGVRTELIDALVVRYLRNREVFMKTFPDGIENIETDPVSIWATLMISPADETRESSG